MRFCFDKKNKVDPRQPKLPRVWLGWGSLGRHVVSEPLPVVFGISEALIDRRDVFSCRSAQTTIELNYRRPVPRRPRCRGSRRQPDLIDDPPLLLVGDPR